MKFLFTGKGTSGSWKIRGEQLGAAVGGLVVPNAPDMRGFNATIIVKRPISTLMDVAKKRTGALIWDVVDAWSQPTGNMWPKEVALDWLAQMVKMVKPDGIVAATDAMANDLRRITGVPVIWLPHHARPGYSPIEIRPVKVVGYEGSPNYLGRYRDKLLTQCAARGWQFVENPPDYRSMDIVVALRDFQGYPARSWKSNVKLANAQAHGVPIIMSDEAGYLETACGKELLCKEPDDIPALLEALSPISVRRDISEAMQKHIITLESVAGRYEQWLLSNFC